MEPDLFTQKRIEVMIEMANKKLLNDVAQLKQQVEKLENEVGRLRSNGHARIEQPRPMQPQMVAPQITQPVQRTGDQPRYGNYTSNDVSIEKFFNFGSRRR